MNRAAALLRYLAAALLLVGGLVHLKLYFDGYRDAPDENLGRSFLLQVVASVVVAIAVAVRRDWWVRIAGIAVAGGTLVAFALSRTDRGIFGAKEEGLDPSPEALIFLIAEVGAIVLLAVLLATDRPRAGAGEAERPRSALLIAAGAVIVTVGLGVFWSQQDTVELVAAPSAVGIADFAFDPPDLSVPAGTEVTWTNGDGMPHSVVADDGAFQSDTLDTGATFSTTFDTAGHLHLRLRHPQQHARHDHRHLTAPGPGPRGIVAHRSARSALRVASVDDASAGRLVRDPMLRSVMPERAKGCPRACKAIGRSPRGRRRAARGGRGPVREVGAGPARRHARPRCRARLRLPGPFDPVDPDTRRRCAPCRGVRGGPADRAAPRARRDHGHLRAAGRPAGCRRPSRDRRRSPRLRSVVRSPARVRLPRARRRCRPGARGARPPSRSDRRPLHGRCGRPGRTHPSRRPRHDPGLRPRAGEQHGERPGRSLAKPRPGRRPRAARARDVQSPPAPWGGPGPGQLRRRAPVEPRGGGARHRPRESHRSVARASHAACWASI